MLGWMAAIRALGAARLEWDAQSDLRHTATRRYRADAQAILFSMPLFRRSGVGAGSATWSEDGGVRLLEFIGYSFPERAAGLNRFGTIRELCRTQTGGAESLYFGVMTSSPEESAAEARAALHSTAQTQLYTAIQGRVARGQMETESAHFTAPARLSAAQSAEIVELARQALAAAPSKSAEFQTAASGELTFLQTLAAMLENPGQTESRYIYNARRYRLSLHQTPDAKATAQFRQKGLIAADGEVVRGAGRLRREAGGGDINFLLWFEKGAARPIPLRIEYQAKSYLRLVFESV